MARATPDPGSGRSGTAPPRRLPACTRAAQRLRIALVAALAALPLACADRGAAPAASPPDVLLLVLDTVGAAHLGLYGYERDTTPNLDRLGREGLVFENAIAQSSWTLPSVASLLTSRYPSEVFAELAHDVVPSEAYPTLARVFRDAGYRTVAITTNPYTSDLFQLMDGFERREYETSAPAGWVVDRALEALASAPQADAGAEAPLFLYLHFMDSHQPWTVGPPWDTHFPTLDGRPHEPAARKRLEFGDPAELDTPAFDVYRSHALALYDGSLRYTDAQIGRLLAALEASGRLANTLVAVAADHGEELWQHAREGRALGLAHPQRPGVYGVGHGHTLFPELIRVPLILWGPGVPAGRVPQQVRNVDLAPTLLGLAGVPAAALDPRGVDLVARLAAGELSDLPAWSETTSPSALQRSLLDGDRQYLRLDDRELLFDSDDDRLVDRAGSEPERLDALREDYERMWSGFERAEPGGRVLDPEVRAKLRALGYAH